MNPANYTCGEFSERLASRSPTPGGGSASAMTGSFGAALCAMAANFTVGRERYAAYEELMKETLLQANNLREEFLAAAAADAEAYDAVGASLSMPKSTPDEKAARRQTLQDALKKAAAVPMGVMELSLEALRITDKITAIVNRNVASDLGVAALSLRTSLCGAWLNVRTNLGGIKDEAFTDEYRKKGETLMAEALPIADRIYDEIFRACGGKTP